MRITYLINLKNLYEFYSIKKSPKKSSVVIPSMIFNWFDVNRSIDSIRKEI